MNSPAKIAAAAMAIEIQTSDRDSSIPSGESNSV
jgi:hypothetical protein